MQNKKQKNKWRKRKKQIDINKLCLDKVKYNTEKEANVEALRRSMKVGCGEPGCCPVYDCYKCPLCEGYHVYNIPRDQDNV